MFKKIVAGAMSAVLCASALLSDSPIGSRRTSQVGEQAPAAAQSDSSEGLSGSNSFAKYLQQQSEQKMQKPAGKNMQAEAAETRYSVTNLEFDAETGHVRVVSTQTYAQKLVVSFIDEDNPANVYRIEKEVEAGEYLFTDLDADLSSLPEFFTVRAQLVNRLGQPMCEAFTLKTCTRFVQKMKATDITEFESEQVVNLDENADTNFIVLSEDTVRAESAENVNTLVSADYDQNVYVFENIDATIRSLEKGQFFFIQPTEEDMISTKIADIQIDGNTATLIGQSDLDGMFDFIKIEYTNESTVDYDRLSDDEAHTEEPESESETEQFSEQHYDAVNAVMADSKDDGDSEKDKKENKGKSKFEVEFPLNQFTDPEYKDDNLNLSFSHEFKKTLKGSVDFSMKLSLSVKFKSQVNIYQDFFDKDYQYVLTTTVTPTATGSVSNAKNTLSKNILEELQSDDTGDVTIKEEKDGSKKIILPTPIPGINETASLGISLKPTLVGEASITYESTRGFRYDGHFTEIKGDRGITKKSLNIKASLAITLQLSVGVDVLGIFEAGVEASLTLTITAEVTFVQKFNTVTNEESENVTAFFVADSDTDTRTMHACNLCIHGQFKLDFKAGVYFKALIFKWPLTLMDLPIMREDWYYSITHNECGMGKCPHIAYKTTLQINCYDVDNNCSGSIPDGSRIKVDGEMQAINNNGEVLLYCTPKVNHSYEVFFEGNSVSKGTFTLDSESKTVKIPVNVRTDENGSIDYRATRVTKDGATDDAVVAVTTAPVTTSAPATTMGTVPQVPAHREDQHPIQLGENIFGHLYPTGYLFVHGYGDMSGSLGKDEFNRDRSYANYAPYKDQVRVIVMQDADPENGYYINSIRDGAFSGMTNLQCVYMPAKIREIGDSAFSGCENLKYLRYGGDEDETETFKLPTTLTTIGKSAFSGCKSAVFGDLKISSIVTSIGDNAFEGCEGLTSVNVPGTPELTVGKNAFKDCTNLKKAVLNAGIGSIGGNLFFGSNALESLTIPSFDAGGMTVFYQYFGPYGFFDEKSDVYVVADTGGGYGHVLQSVPKALKEITVASGTEIPDIFFMNLSMVETINYPDDITAIGVSAFKNCAALKEIKIPDTVTEIRTDAFAGCSSAQFGDLMFSDNLAYIGTCAFQGCNGLTSVVIPGENHLKLCGLTFEQCENLKKAVLCEGIEYAHESSAHSTDGGDFFKNCFRLESLTIPNFDKLPMVKYARVWDYFGTFGSSTRVDRENIPDYAESVQIEYHAIPAALKEIIVTSGTEVPQSFFRGMNMVESYTLPGELETVLGSAFANTAPKEAYLIGDEADWDNVEIQDIEDSNKPLADLVRKGKPLMLLADPTDRTVKEGQTAWFTVYTAGKYTPSYQWQCSTDGGSTWTDVEGEGAKLSFTAAMDQNGNLYRCIVTDEKGNKEVQSEHALLTVTKKAAGDKPEGYMPGDIDGSGRIDVSDAVLLARFVAEDKTAVITSVGILNGDVNGDGKATLDDITTLLLYIAKRIRVFPVAEM